MKKNMKKNKAEKDRKVRVGFNLCSHWCGLPTLTLTLPSRHVVGLYFLDPSWVVGAMSRLRISLLT